MLKVLFIAIAVIVIFFVIFSIMCAMIAAGRSDVQADDKFFYKNQICPTCKTGKESYELDNHSYACPYISCLKDGKCSFYEPLEKTIKKPVCQGEAKMR